MKNSKIRKLIKRRTPHKICTNNYISNIIDILSCVNFCEYESYNNFIIKLVIYYNKYFIYYFKNYDFVFKFLKILIKYVDNLESYYNSAPQCPFFYIVDDCDCKPDKDFGDYIIEQINQIYNNLDHDSEILIKFINEIEELCGYYYNLSLLVLLDNNITNTELYDNFHTNYLCDLNVFRIIFSYISISDHQLTD